MATQSEIDYALMAGHAYQLTRADVNQFPVPNGWMEFFHVPSPHFPTTSGFEAISFQRGSDIVIAFAGTDAASWEDLWADFTLAAGLGSSQLDQAALYYLQVKAANPKATISFTGHSLGGGLAALMGVFFDEKAVTFDQAPFANTANTDIRDHLIAYLHGKGYSDSQLMVLAPELLAYQGNGDRVANVSGYFVQGDLDGSADDMEWRVAA